MELGDRKEQLCSRETANLGRRGWITGSFPSEETLYPPIDPHAPPPTLATHSQLLLTRALAGRAHRAELGGVQPLARVIWLSAEQRNRALHSAVLGHSTGRWGARGPSPPALAGRQDRCGCRGTHLSLKPRARVSQCRGSTITSEDCKYLVPQRGSSPSSRITRPPPSPCLLVLCFLEVSNTKRKIFLEQKGLQACN